MKEESTPYDGADSLKQIRVLSTFQFTRFQLTELFACSCPQDCLASTLATSSEDFHLPCRQLIANLTKIRIIPNLCQENLVGFLIKNVSKSPISTCLAFFGVKILNIHEPYKSIMVH